MQPAFWKQRWQEGQIGFHSTTVHPDLIEHESTFLQDGPHRILVPLCGKSVDLAWLAERGHPVVGIELVRSAVEELFQQANLTPEWTEVSGGECATAGNITVFVGDLFELDADAIGPVSRVWDRAALIALHPNQRPAYTERLLAWLQPGGHILMNVLAYDPALMDGPPWSVRKGIVRRLYPSAQEIGRRDALDDRWRARGHEQLDAVTWRIDR